MSFELPSVKVKPQYPENVAFDTGSYGVPELMKHGFTDAASSGSLHPLAPTELNYNKNRETLNMTVLRNTQGLHAPLRLQMELNAAAKIGRLPFLHSSNIMYDCLTGDDLIITPGDLYNVPEFREVSGQPHAVVEKSLGLL